MSLEQIIFILSVAAIATIFGAIGHSICELFNNGKKDPAHADMQAELEEVRDKVTKILSIVEVFDETL
jgi:hypothetical protein